MRSFDLIEPRKLDDIFDLLTDGEEPVRPMGGGTALMLMMKANLFAPARLVSLRHLGAPFVGLSFDPESSVMRIGALTTFSQLEHSADIAAHLPVVTQTMKTLANVRVRNVASVGGNLAHADPHLDLPPVWLALDADVMLVSRNGERIVPVEEIFAGYYETTIADGELVAELRVPVKAGWRSTYVKITTRAAHDWPALGLTISVSGGPARIDDLRLVLSAALDRPTRLREAEAVLRGRALDDDVLREAGDAAVAEVDIESDSRGSSAYKQELLRVHLRRGLVSLLGAA